jgi:hypothetical protein
VAAVNVLAVLGSLACSPAKPGASNPATASARPNIADLETLAADAAKTLDGFHAAAREANEARYFSYFAASGVFLGTDPTERWTVPAFRAYAHPHFAKGKAWSFRPTRRSLAVAPSAEYAWFDEDLETERLGPARGSGVLLRDGNAWKIAQYNLSIPIPNDKFVRVRDIISGSAPGSVTGSATGSPPAANVGSTVPSASATIAGPALQPPAPVGTLPGLPRPQPLGF